MKTRHVILAELNRERYGSDSDWFTRHDPSAEMTAQADLFDDSDTTTARRRRQLLADVDRLNAKEAQ